MYVVLKSHVQLVEQAAREYEQDPEPELPGQADVDRPSDVESAPILLDAGPTAPRASDAVRRRLVAGKAHPAGRQVLHGVDQMRQVAAEAVELPDHDSRSNSARHVVLPQGSQAAVESRPVVAEARGAVVVEVDRVDAGRLQGVALQVQRLGAVGSSRRGRSDALRRRDRIETRSPWPASRAERPTGTAKTDRPE